MKFNRAFSMAEMMVVMLIAAVVLAASAPMMTRKVQHDQLRTDIFQVLNNDERNAVEFVAGDNQRIFMNTDRENGYVGIVPNGVTIPQGSVYIGNNTQVAGNNFVNNTALGISTTTGQFSTAVGFQSDAGAQNATAVGATAVASNSASAFGFNARATADNSVALGNGAQATADNSVALGNGAQATLENTIVLGNSDTTVYIPGSLVIDHSALVGRAANRNDNLYFRPYAQEDGRHFAVLNAGDWQGDDSNVTLVQDATNDNKLVVRVGPYSTATEWWDSDYGDNNRTHINFEDSSKGDNTKSYHISDIRLKNVGEEFKGGLEELSKLNFYHFTFKQDEKKTPHVGVMAQDLQKVFPDAVKADEEGWLRIRWDEMFYAVINAVKELNTKICALAEDVVKLKERTEENDKAQAEMIAQLMENVKTQDAIIKKQQEQIDELTKQVKNLAKSKEKRERN